MIKEKKKVKAGNIDGKKRIFIPEMHMHVFTYPENSEYNIRLKYLGKSNVLRIENERLKEKAYKKDLQESFARTARLKDERGNRAT